MEGFDKEIACQVSAYDDAENTYKDIGPASVKYINVVENLFYYSQTTDLAKCKEKIEENDYTQLHKFIHELEKWFEEIGLAQKAVTEKCDEAAKKFTECAESCAIKQAKARSRKNTAKVTGVIALTLCITVAMLAVVGMLTMQDDDNTLKVLVYIGTDLCYRRQWYNLHGSL